MRRLATVLLVACLFITIATSSDTRSISRQYRQISRGAGFKSIPEDLDPGMRGLVSVSAGNVYCLAFYDFDTGPSSDWQGWTHVDNTEQMGIFTHVDDFSGLSGGDYGYLVPLQGFQSMWCGVRPDPFDPYLCSWATAPGYGRNWNQMLVCLPIPFVAPLSISYRITYDTEPDFDYVALEHSNPDGTWTEVMRYTGAGFDVFDTHVIPAIPPETSIRFHFVSDHEYDDQDGFWNTDGGFIVDEIMITDNTGPLNYEDFEAAPIGATSSGIWMGETEMPYGIYSGLETNLFDWDPCNDNYTAQVIFFQGSPFPSAAYPGLFDTPYCYGAGGVTAPCQNEMVVSPVIDMTMYSFANDENQDTPIPPADIANLNSCYMSYTVYRDLPVQNLVYHYWEVRSIDTGGCPGAWRDFGTLYCGDERAYIQMGHEIGHLIEEDQIQVAVGCVDMCDAWFGIYGDCAAHTPAPFFDNVKIERYAITEPRWSYREMNLFQDNFPSDPTDLTSWVRADAALDVNDPLAPFIMPGDSVVVTCFADHVGGLDPDSYGNPMIYCHLKASYVGDPATPKPDLVGPSVAGNYGRYASDNGTWTILQMEPARYGGGMIAWDTYMIDFNDSLFTYGYCIDYYFKAYYGNGNVSWLPTSAEAGNVDLFEFTCLPTTASNILIVSDSPVTTDVVDCIPGVELPVPCRITWTDLEPAWAQSFEAVLPDTVPWPDCYYVNDAASMVSNGPGSRASVYHLESAYGIIIWDCGDEARGTISDGTNYSDKSNDAQLLVDWITASEHQVGLWVLGDDVANDLNAAPGPAANTLMRDICGVNPVEDSYFELTGGMIGGGVINPAVTVLPLWPPGGTPPWISENFCLYGGCDLINDFDVLEKLGNGEYAMAYPDYMATPYYAGIFTDFYNGAGSTMRTMWCGFSLEFMRECGLHMPMLRNELVADVLEWMGAATNWDVTGTGDTPPVTSLAQNYPNPFNPVTRIEFTLSRETMVTMNVYNVAGQLVRTLANEVWEAGSHHLDWDGTNNHGAAVASGVYFYRMQAGEFVSERKMVLLR